MFPSWRHGRDNSGIYNSLNSISPTLPIAPCLPTPLPPSPINSDPESAGIQLAPPLALNSTFKFSNTDLKGAEINGSKDSQQQSQFV